MKHKHLFARCLGVGLLILILTACSGLESLSEAAPQSTLTLDPNKIATSVARIRETASGQSTLTPEATAPASPVRQETPTVETGADLTLPAPETGDAQACPYFPQAGVPQPLPDPGQLKWLPQSGEAGRWRVLEGLGAPLQQALPAPGGRWWAVRVLRQYGDLGSTETALYILDGDGDDHWLASDNGYIDYHEFAWTSDSGLLWVSGSQLWIASPSGEQRRSLDAPEPVYEVWVGASDLVLVSGKSGLWRLDMTTGGWSAVSELSGLASRQGMNGFSNPQANLALSPDGGFLTLAAANSVEVTSAALWKIPFNPEEPAHQVAEYTYLGRGGRLPAPQPLAGSLYWYPNQTTGAPGTPDASELVLINEYTSERVPLATLIPEDADLLALQISPDARWLALQTSPSGADPAQAKGSIILIPADQLEAGRVVPGDAVVAWRSSPPAAWLVHSDAGQQTLDQIDLPGGGVLILTQTPSETLRAVEATDHATLVFQDSQAYLFEPGGGIKGKFPLPVSLSETTVLESGSIREVFIAGINAIYSSGACAYQFPVILWEIP